MPDWPHSPVHRIHEAGTYMFTAGTYLKQSVFRGPDRLGYLCETLLHLAADYGWQLQAWAVFPNHYHFVALSPGVSSQPTTPPTTLECGSSLPLSGHQLAGGDQKREQAPAVQSESKLSQCKAGTNARTSRDSLVAFIRHLHSVTSIQANRWNQTPGRQNWFQYRDTELTFQKSYLARLNYVHTNAVHHGLVREPSLYPWCSAGWFERRAATSFYKTVMAIKVDRVQVVDDFPVDRSDL